MQPRMVPYQPERLDPADSLRRARAFRVSLDGRRTVRMFDSTPVPREVMEEILIAAGSAPSGAHKQPWTFVAVSSADVKRKIRAAAEEQERRFYDELAPEEWLADLAPLGTDWEKHHITDAPWVVVLFAQDYALDPDGSKSKHYYVNESVGIAAGFFIAAVRQAGLVTLTHTPSPMKFLRELLQRPSNERAYLLLPVGHAAPDCVVPDLRRKELQEFVEWR
jgi:iodotyrosine deiodinase